MKRPDWTYGCCYRAWSRLLHRFDLHHTRRIGPVAPDGAVFHRCEWCGVSRTDHTLESLRRNSTDPRSEPKTAGPRAGAEGAGPNPCAIADNDERQR